MLPSPNAATETPWVTVDIDCETRTDYDIGADEITSGTCIASITPTNPGICAGGSIALTASGGNTYNWSTGSTNASINGSPTVTTTYTVTITASGGCTATASTTVTVNPLPTAVILINGSVAPASFSLCGTDELDIASQVSGSNYTYKWYKNSNLTGFTGSSKDNIHLNPGTYRLRVTRTSTGCSALSAPVQITCPGAPAKTDDGLFDGQQVVSMDIHPNPFTAETNISFQTELDNRVSVKLYGLDGKEVANLLNEEVEGGEVRNLTFDGSHLPTGVYILHLATENGEVQRQKLVISR